MSVSTYTTEWKVQNNTTQNKSNKHKHKQMLIRSRLITLLRKT